MSTEQTARPDTQPVGFGTHIGLALVLAFTLGLGVVLMIGAGNLLSSGGHGGAAALAGICGLALEIIGLWLAYRAYGGHRGRKTGPGLANAPWMERKDWASGRMVDPQIGRVIFLYLFLACWLGGFIVIGTVNFDKILAGMDDGVAPWLAGGFLLLVTATLINLALKMTHAWLRVGEGVLILDTLPGHIGGAFKARLVTRMARAPETEIRADLSCIRASAKPDAMDGDSMIWWDALTIAPKSMRRSKEGLAMPVNFAIPADLPETGPDVTWQLRISSLDPRADFMLFEWAVPVFEARRR